VPDKGFTSVLEASFEKVDFPEGTGNLRGFGLERFEILDSSKRFDHLVGGLRLKKWIFLKVPEIHGVFV